MQKRQNTRVGPSWFIPAALLKITHVRKALIPLEDTITPRSSIIFLTQLYFELNFNMNFGKDEQHSNHSKDS